MLNRRFLFICGMILCSHIHLNAILTYEQLHKKASDYIDVLNNLGSMYIQDFFTSTFEDTIKKLFADDYKEFVNRLIRCNSREEFIQKLRINKETMPIWVLDKPWILADEQKQCAIIKYSMYKQSTIIINIVAIVYFNTAEKIYYIDQTQFFINQ